MTSSIHVIDALLCFALRCVALMMGASHLPALMYIHFSSIYHLPFSCLFPSLLFSPYDSLSFFSHPTLFNIYVYLDVYVFISSSSGSCVFLFLACLCYALSLRRDIIPYPSTVLRVVNLGI
jgi:hypothetical protein